jgi:hypothetical protein
MFCPKTCLTPSNTLGGCGINGTNPPTQIASDLADFPLSDPGHRALASAKTPTTIRLVPTSNTRSFATTYR